jgi:predicted AlkP superfamily phosphohydrolase/phosphomutase
MQGVYESFDGMIARILEKADRRTLVVIASDHGAIPRGCNLDLEKVLAGAGILALRDDASVDWSNTKAAPLGDAHVFVNLKGREPDGAVDPADYENVREEVINALMDHVEPESGKHPIAFALRREDARILGLYGDHVGDVIFCVEPGHGLGQGQHLPTARWGSCTLRSFLVMAGPNVKKGAQLERNVWLVDIAPTICYLMDIPFPKTMEGAILYQALQDPSFRLTEKGRLGANYERLRRAYDAEISLTHTYNR